MSESKPKTPRDVGQPKLTLYIRNLNEKISANALKLALKSVFAPHGEVVNVHARRSVRMRGQAFVVFRDVAGAERGLKLHGFPLFNKSLEVSYANSKSEYTARFDGSLAELKEQRTLDADEREQKFQELAKRAHDNGLSGAAKNTDAQSMFQSAYMQPQKKSTQVPDELLPPNNILFVQNLPSIVNASILENLFRKYPGMVEVRTVSGRTDIAFIEFESDFMAGAAKTGLNGYQVAPDCLIKVTFGRK